MIIAFYILITGHLLVISVSDTAVDSGCRTTVEGSYYTGRLDTVGSKRCLPWSDYTEHHDDQFPDRDKAAAKSYCRAVASLSYKEPWCYTEHGPRACDVPLCPEIRECLLYRNGKKYQGTADHTRSGRLCKPFGRYCRNPPLSNHSAPWCYVATGQQEDCDVPLCPGVKALYVIQPANCTDISGCKDFHLYITHRNNSEVYISPKSLQNSHTNFVFLVMTSGVAQFSLHTDLNTDERVVYKFLLNFAPGRNSSAKLTGFRSEKIPFMGNSSTYSAVWVDWTEGFVKLGTGPTVGEDTIFRSAHHGLRCISKSDDCAVQHVALENDEGVAYWVFNAHLAKWTSWSAWTGISGISGGRRERTRSCNGSETRLNFCVGPSLQTPSAKDEPERTVTTTVTTSTTANTTTITTTATTTTSPSRPNQERRTHQSRPPPSTVPITQFHHANDWTKTIVLCLTIAVILLIAILAVWLIMKRRYSQEVTYAQAVQRICRGQSLPVGSFGWPRQTPQSWPSNSIYLFPPLPPGMPMDECGDQPEHIYDSLHETDHVSPLPNSRRASTRTARPSVSSTRSAPRSSISSVRSIQLTVETVEI